MADLKPGETIEDVFAAAAAGEQTPVEPEAEDTPTAEPQDFYLGTYRDRDAAEQGLAEKERMIGELGNRAGEAERRLAELEAQEQYRQQYVQPPAQYQQPVQSQYITDDQIAQVRALVAQKQREGDDYEALLLSNQLTEAISDRQIGELRDELAQTKAELSQPMIEMRNEAVTRSAIEGAKTLLGPTADEDLHEYRDVVIDAAKSQPQLLQSEGGLRADTIARLVLGEKALRERQGQSPPRNEQGQFVPVTGGSGAEPSPETTPQTEQLEPGDPRLAFMKEVKKDAFGTIPQFAGQ